MTKNVFFLTLSLFVFDASVFSQTLDKIIDNYLSARGQSNFNELQTLVVKGEGTVINGNLKSDFKNILKILLSSEWTLFLII
jgi:hypothetical protein